MINYSKSNYHAVAWDVSNPKAIVVIAHGMAEHAERYDDFAKYLNSQEISVHAIHHLGHGEAIEEIKGHFEKDGFDNCVDNIRNLILDLRKEHKLPIYLFGHSMGSFMSQAFIKKYSSDIEGVILCGSSKVGLLHYSGNILTKVLFCLADNKKQNPFLNNLSFGSYNNNFKPARTDFDWLSRDEKQVDKYVEDDLCGFICTTGFYKSFFSGLSKLNKNIDDINKDLPIYIIAGDKDPVGNNGKDVIKLCHNYLLHEIKDVEIKLYEGARHEILNETNKEEVYNDVKDWLIKHIEALE